MKAILLAGGFGTRAKPFSDYLPKALIPLDGRPVIDYIIRYLAKFPEISELIIVCEFDRFGKQIINYFDGKETLIGKSITFVEDKKNGTGGALLNVEKNVMEDVSEDDDVCFLVWFADNLCALKIDDMIRKYNRINNNTPGRGRQEEEEEEKATITGMVVVRNRRFQETGRVILDKKWNYTVVEDDPHNYNHNDNDVIALIKQFTEKGVVKLDQPEAVGIYLFNRRIFDYLHNKLKQVQNHNGGHSSFDLSHDILEQIPRTGRLFSFDIGKNIEWVDIESPMYAERNKDIIKNILSQMKW